MEKAAQFFDDFPFISELTDEKQPQDMIVYDDDLNVEEKDDDEFVVSEKDEDQDNDSTTETIEVNLPEDAENLPEIIEEIKEDISNPEKENVAKEYIFKLDAVPGAESDSDILEEDDSETTEVKEEESAKIKTKDEWDWRSLGMNKFLDWLQERFTNVPKHSGQDTTGIERCVAYFKRLNTEISRAMSEDYKREIDAAKAEQARSEIMDGMKRLLERLDKLNSKKFKQTKKKANDESEQLVKIAETSTTGKIVVTVPYLISNIARTCIEATVQGGKDIEDCFEKLTKEYNLDKREQAQVVQLIKDMGYPIMLDRMNPFKDIKPSSSETSEYQTNYYA